MEGKKKLRAISVDLLWSIAAMVALNATIQFILYPQLHALTSDAIFGDILTLLSVISIISSSFGSAANYSRMLASSKNRAPSSDYLKFLFLTGIACTPLLLIALNTLGNLSLRTMVLYSVLMLVSLLRYYCDVEYRLHLDYRKYFLYYFFVALGYTIGLLIFREAEQWYDVLILGEVCALLFAALTSPVFRGYSVSKSECFGINCAGWMQLSISNLIANGVLNADRILIRYLIGGSAVTVFYVATLMGKVISMISTPLNGVIIGYITKYKKQINGKAIQFVGLVSLIITPLLGIVCVLGTEMIIPILYPGVLDDNLTFVFLACLGQVLYFISNTLMVFIMKMYSEKMALWISIGYGVLFFMTAVPMTIGFGLMGMAEAVLIVNAIKMGVILYLAYRMRERLADS